MTGVVILAAGASSRLGRPKQDLIYKGKTLLQHAVNAAIGLGSGPVVLVLGADTSADMPELDSKMITVHNADWQQGMSTSIRAGITQLQKTAGISGAIIMLCDQPFANAELLKNILQKKNDTGKGIVACAYNNTLGVPVYFARGYFTHLLALQGHEGAKKLISAYADDTAAVNFEQGGVDIDTMDDYERLVQG